MRSRGRVSNDQSELELQFINLSSNYNGDPDTKKVVRKYVMTKYRRDQRKEQSSATSKPHRQASRDKSTRAPRPGKVNTISSPSSPSTPLSDFEPRRRIPEADIQDDDRQELQNEAQLVRLPPMLGVDQVDPLNSLPIHVSSHTGYLLDHFNQFITWRVSHLPNTLFANFFHYSLTDPALANAMMIYAANHDQFTTGRSRVVDICHHKFEATRILNSRLRNPTPDISDETIVTIAGMVIFEEMFGSSESARTHRAGLQQLVQLRGGIDKLGTPYVSAPFVGQALILPSSVSSWEEKYAHPAQKTPYMTPPPRTPSPAQAPYSISIPYPTLAPILTVAPKTRYLSTCECSKPHPPYPPTPSGWDEIMKETFIRLKDSSSLFSSTIHTEHHLSIHNESYLVESRIVELIEGFETEDRGDKSTVKVVYGKSWVLGCRLYLYTVLRCSESRPVRSHVLQGLLKELRISLSEDFCGYREVYESFNKGSDTGAVSQNYHERYYSSDVLLWVLLVAGSNALSLLPTPASSPLQPRQAYPFSKKPKLTTCTTLITNTVLPTYNKSANNSSDLSWYLSAIKHLSSGLKITSWAVVKQIMEELPWIEWKIEGRYRSFWEFACFSETGRDDTWTVFHSVKVDGICDGNQRGKVENGDTWRGRGR